MIEKGFRGRAGSNGKDQENDLERPGKKQGKGEDTGSSEKSSEGLGKGGKMHKKAVNNRKGRILR